MFRELLTRYRRGATVVLLLLISFSMILFSRKGNVNSLRMVGFTVFSSFQNMFHSTGSFVSKSVSSVSRLNKIEKELKETREDLERYKKIIKDLNELNKENIELRKFLELKHRIDYSSEACEIISRNPETMFDLFIINKGSSSGIKENMPVISYKDGENVFIGKTVEVTPFASKVITLSNPKFKAGAVISSTNTHCIVQGDNNSTTMAKLLYVPKGLQLEGGKSHHIYTSGDSIFYPRGLKIGKIVNIIPSERYELFYEAEIETAIDLSEVDYVLVLKTDVTKDNFKKMELVY